MTARTDVSVSVNGKRVTGTAGTLNHTTRVGVRSARHRNGKCRGASLHSAVSRRVRIDPRAMPPKPVAVVCAVSLTVGWLLASMLTPPVARLQTLPERRAENAPKAIDTASYSEPLTLKLRQSPAPPQPRRNPFMFGGRESRPNDQIRETAPEVPLAPPRPATPAYKLSGIGFTETPQGVVRTAVVSDGAAVHLLKTGDAIGVYTVADVTDSSVVLTEVAGGRFVIRLR